MSTATLREASACGGIETTKRSRSVVLVSRETGTLWFAGWLFTIGFMNLTFWKGLLALIIWPYYLGVLAAGG